MCCHKYSSPIQWPSQAITQAWLNCACKCSLCAGAAGTRHRYHQETAVSIELELHSDYSLQLLLLIYPATLSNVGHLLPPRLVGDACTKDFGGLRSMCSSVSLTRCHRVSLCSAPASRRIKCLYSAWRVAISNQIPLQWPTQQSRTRPREDREGSETEASLSDWAKSHRQKLSLKKVHGPITSFKVYHDLKNPQVLKPLIFSFVTSLWRKLLPRKVQGSLRSCAA